MTRPRLLVVAALLLAAPLALAACGGDPQDDYCEAVREHQSALSDVAASDDTGALFGALDAYDDLAEQAPRDIADDWSDVVGALHALEQAVEAAGVDPSTYSAEEPPADLDAAARRDIEAAARDVGSARTVAAMAAVEQHALDVCGTPLAR